MQTHSISLNATIVCLAFFFPDVLSAAERKDRPNILLIMADDLGFSDLGCYGGEINTPNLNSLAKGGLRYTQFYNTARCWPTRAALMTGYYAQQVQRDALPGLKRGNRPKWAKLLSERLKPAGYRTYHSGKWHIDSTPLKTGFDRSFYLRDQHRFFNPLVLYEDDGKLPAVKRESGFYGTVAIGDHAVKCLQQHAADHANEPFFHYLAFTAPHFPLHALPQDIEKYSSRYDAGWEKVRQRRYEMLKAMGIVTSSLSEVEPEIGPPYDFPDAMKILGAGEVNRPLPWNKLTPQQKRFQAAKMEVHAAMVDRMDQEIGRVLKQLRDMQAIRNTLIFFLSDNGASAEIMVRGDGHDPDAPAGSADSHLCLGPGWSNCCNTPFRRHKTWVHEGGTSTPLIVHWPDGIKEDRGKLRHAVGHVIDIVPTVLEVAGINATDSFVDSATDIPKLPGRSLLSGFQNKRDPGRSEIWWNHEDNRAIRMGNMKLVAAKGETWSLYDLENDRTEQNDLAPAQPDRVQRMSKRWQEFADDFVALAKRFPANTKPPKKKKKRKSANGQ